MQVWLDDLLPFVGVLIGASIGLLGTWLGLRRQRRAEWQRWLHETAAESATKLAGASTAVEHAISSLENSSSQVSVPDAEKAVNDAEWLVNEVELPLSRVRLLFGEDSRVYGAARTASENLRRAAARLRDYHKEERTGSGLSDAREAYMEAEKQESEFVSRAN
jgi:hypothetical protein